jgi:hypothetical protein
MARTSAIPTPGAAIYAETAKALKGLAAATTKKTWSPGNESLSDVDVADLRKMARRHKQNTDRLSRIWYGASKAQFEHTRTRYLEAFPTRICATIRAFAKSRRQGSLGDIYEFAEGLDVWEPLTESVRVRLHPKPKGGYRKIIRSGCRRMTQQFIVRDLLTAIGVDNEYDSSRRGAGGEKALIHDACQRIEDGYRHWQTADVVNCFASLRPEHLGWLPVPKELIRNVVFLPKCTKIEVAKGSGGLESPMPGTQGQASGDVTLPSYMGSIKAPTKKVRRELPQGSILSPLVGRAFLGREIRVALGKEVVRLSFVDDLTLGARSQPKLEQTLDALRARLLGNPAGPVLLHVDRPTSTKQGRVRVFGYVLKPGRGHGDNFIHVHPHRQRFDRFHKKLCDHWKAEGQPSDFEALEDFIIERLRHWMPSQQGWTIVPGFSQNLALTSAFVYVCERDLEDFKKLHVQEG